MKILMTKTELDLTDFQRILTAHDSDYRRKIKLKNYYLGKHDILNKKADRTVRPTAEL